MLHLLRFAALLVLSALTAPGQTAENESQQFNSDSAVLDTITVTASLRERPLREVANSITVIDAARISETLASDIKDLTRYTPWMTVANDPSRFGLSGFTIRGLGGNRVKTVIDGVPVANSFSVGSYASSSRDVISPAIVSRAEVLRGPASALYGSDAMGGVVSYTTLNPDDLLLGRNENRYFGASTRFDGRDNSLAGSLSAAADLSEASLLISATMRRGYEFDNRAIEDSGRPNPRQLRQFDFAGKLVRPTSRGEIAISIDGRRTHATLDVNDREGQGRFASTTMLRGNDRLTRDRISLAGQMRMDSTIADDVNWTVYFQQSSTDQRSIEDRAASRRSPSPTRRFPEFRFDEKVIGASASAARDVQSRRLTHRLIYGLQLDRRTVNESRNNQLVNLDTGDSTNTVLGETFPVRDFPVTRITEAAVFVHDEIGAADGRFTLIPGLRAEYYQLDPQPDLIYLEDNPSSSAVSISEMSLAPKLGAVIQINERVSLFAQYARGFRSPPFEDANIGLEVPLFNVRAIANPDLKPETSDGLELGLRVTSNRWRGSFSVYQNRYKDFIDSKVSLGPDSQTGVLTFQSLNRDRATIKGIEGEFEIDLGLHSQGLIIVGSFANTRGEDKIQGVPLNSVDPLRATLGVRFDHPTQRWGTELVARFAAAKTRVDDSNAVLFRPPGYGVLDMLAYFKFSESSRINLALLNLGNKRYWEWTDVRGRSAEDPLLDFYTRPGFNIAANLAMSW